jgi:DNA invertase Pin-like site-specific DNA recombinase
LIGYARTSTLEQEAGLGADARTRGRGLNLNLDTSTATGRLMLTMIGAIAKFEREMMLKRP